MIFCNSRGKLDVDLRVSFNTFIMIEGIIVFKNIIDPMSIYC